MDNLRFFLFIMLAGVSFMLWQQWQVDYGPKPIPSTAVTKQNISALPPADIPNSQISLAGADVPAEVQARTNALTHTQGNPIIQPNLEKIKVTTDVFSLEIDPKGGELSLLELSQYPVTKDQPETPIKMFDQIQAKYFVAQSGLLAHTQMAAPSHHSFLRPSATRYHLQPGEETLEVPLTWANEQGIEVTKTYIFHRGRYLIDLKQTVSNHSAQSWTGRQYQQLQRRPFKDENSNTFIRTYTGGVVYNDKDKYEKIDFDDMGTDINLNATHGWSAMIQHYFLAAWIPPAEQDSHYYTKALANQHYVIGSYAVQQTVNPGETKEFTAKLFVGPKLQRELEKVAPGLELTVDYGILTLIAKPVFWLLEFFHSKFGNWGWAIICVTLTIKALFFKLSEASYRSMARMRKVQPKLTALKERCGADKQRFNTEMMSLYKREKVNPLGGCLPIMLQIPVFISLYWVLAESVELRQAPFALWIQDLSSKDPYLILPVLMGITMFIQQRLNPTPVDPMQAKIMKMFPFVFTVFFLMFPAGLVLYWVVNNSLSIIQQWYITRRIEAGEDTAK